MNFTLYFHWPLLEVSGVLGESMNNLMKKYMNASISLLEFISAFELTLETRKESSEFLEYKQNNYNILYKTFSKKK